MFRILSKNINGIVLFALLVNSSPVTSYAQSIEVDPRDEIEAIFEQEEAVVKIVDSLKFRVRPFMDGQLKGAVKKLQYGIPYVIEATFDEDPGEEPVGVTLDWASAGTSKDEIEMVRVTQGDVSFYRAVKMVILEKRELDILEIIEAED